jgi:hypothetical protein
MHSTSITRWLSLFLLLACTQFASALTVDGSGAITNWGFTPFGTGPYMGDWTNGAPPLSTGQFGQNAGETSDTTWLEINNAAPIDYPEGTPNYVPSPGNPTGMAFDQELLAWRLISPTKIQVLGITAMDPTVGVPYKGAYLHLGDVFIDVNNDKTYDRVLIAGQWTTTVPDNYYSLTSGYDHTMPFGIYSFTRYHRIADAPYGYNGDSYIKQFMNPFAYYTGSLISTDVNYQAVSHDYGDFYGIDKNKTWILEWTINIADLGTLPTDPNTGLPSLKSLTLHWTTECGNDAIRTPPRTTEPHYFEFGEVGGKLFTDKDGDCYQEDGETSLSGIRIILVHAGPDNVLDTPDDTVTSTTSQANGVYHFNAVPPGTIKVYVDQTTVPSGIVISNGVDQYSFILDSGQSSLNNDFCFKPEPGKVSGLVYCDANLNGSYNDGEPLIENVKVNLLCAGPDGLLDTADDVLLSQVTGPNGAYEFATVAPGDCRVAIDLTTIPANKQPGACATSSDFVLLAGQTISDKNFCLITQPGTITGIAFVDANDDGVRQTSETLLAGIRVILTNSGPDMTLGTADDTTSSQTTDGNGQYLFGPIGPGPYIVAVDTTSIPAGKVAGKLPLSVQLNFPACETLNPIVNFCFKTHGGCVNGTVFCEKKCDTNYSSGCGGSGGSTSGCGGITQHSGCKFNWYGCCTVHKTDCQDSDEPGVGGVTVRLVAPGPDGKFYTADDIVRTTVTDANGDYSFEDVPLGYVKVSIVAGSLPTGILIGNKSSDCVIVKSTDCTKVCLDVTCFNCEDYTCISGDLYNTWLCGGYSLWFNSALKVSGLSNTPGNVTINFTGQTLKGLPSPNGNLNVPNAKVIFSTTVTVATTIFDTPSNTWITTVPKSYGGEVFLSGLNFKVPSRGLGCVDTLKWCGTIQTNSPGVTISWGWASAAYSSFGSTYGSLGVKPVDGNKCNPYNNYDSQGTPECFKSKLVSGGRCSGGSNYTGYFTCFDTINCGSCR